MTPTYEEAPPYARVGVPAPLGSEAIATPQPKSIWTERAKQSISNMASSPIVLVFSTEMWLGSFFISSRTLWFPAVWFFVLSFVLYKGRQQVEYIGNLPPTTKKVVEIGWVGVLAMACMAISWILFTVLKNWLIRWWVRKVTSMGPPHRGGMQPPTVSSPTTSAARTLSADPHDSLVSPAPVDGLLGGPTHSQGVRIRSITQRGFNVNHPAFSRYGRLPPRWEKNPVNATTLGSICSALGNSFAPAEIVRGWP